MFDLRGSSSRFFWALAALWTLGWMGVWVAVEPAEPMARADAVRVQVLRVSGLGAIWLLGLVGLRQGVGPLWRHLARWRPTGPSLGSVPVSAGLSSEALSKAFQLPAVNPPAHPAIAPAEGAAAASAAETAADRVGLELLALFSHEVRKPMTAILGFAQLLQRESDLASRHRQQLSSIQRSGEELLRLLEDIVDFAKLDTGRMRLVAEPFDFRALLDDVESHARHRAAARGLDFRVRRSAGIPAGLHGDEAMVRRILTGILQEALGYPLGGGVALAVSATLGCPAGSRPASYRLQAEVTRTGGEWSLAAIESAFEPLAPAGGGRYRGGSAGLGLAIHRRLARLLGGDLTVTCRGQQCLVFEITFVAEAASSSEPAGAPLAAFPGDRAPDSRAGGAALAVEDLPDGLREGLLRATEAGDLGTLRVLIASQVAPRHPQLAQGLGRLVEAFDLEALLRLLQPRQP